MPNCTVVLGVVRGESWAVDLASLLAATVKEVLEVTNFAKKAKNAEDLRL